MNPRSVCVVACCALALFLPQSGRSQTAISVGRDGSEPSYSLRGIVTDAAAREPIPEAEVVIIEPPGTGRSAATDERGRFDLGSFAPGRLSFRVRRLGYEQRTIEIQMGANGQPASVEVALLAIPAELAKVYVMTDPQGRLSEFYQRRQHRGTFGKFMEQDEIRRISPLNASELFRGVPGIHISTNPAGGNTIRIRNCQPMVLIDGQRVPGAELDEVVIPGDIAAIEFYPSSAGVPAQYVERGNRLCGLILVWTKSK
jgi:hypothetical protein